MLKWLRRRSGLCDKIKRLERENALLREQNAIRIKAIENLEYRLRQISGLAKLE